jgi:hypothetical protein
LAETTNPYVRPVTLHSSAFGAVVGAKNSTAAANDRKTKNAVASRWATRRGIALTVVERENSALIITLCRCRERISTIAYCLHPQVGFRFRADTDTVIASTKHSYTQWLTTEVAAGPDHSERPYALHANSYDPSLVVIFGVA